MKIQKLAVALFALGLGQTAAAGSFACSDQNVTVPCNGEGAHFVAEGLFLQAANDDLEYYGDMETFDLNAAGFQRFAVKPKHRIGWRFEGAYHFPNATDITVNWTHHHNTRNASLVVEDDTIASGQAKFDFDSVNLEIGQWFKVGGNGKLRVHFGAQYLKLDHHLGIAPFEVLQPPQPGGFFDSLEDGSGALYYSEFKGVGPRLGVDWIHNLGEGFHFVARGAAELLIGNMDYRIDGKLESQEPGVMLENTSRRAIIPGLEGRMGLRWSSQVSAWIVSLEGGWHAAGYFQSIHHGAISYAHFPDRPTQNVSNYGQHGPYVNIMVHA